MLSLNKDYIQNNIEDTIKELFKKDGFYPWNDSTFSNYFGNIYEYITKDTNTFLSMTNPFPPSKLYSVVDPYKEFADMNAAERCSRRANNNRNFITWMLKNQQGKLVEWIDEKEQTFYLMNYDDICKAYDKQTSTTATTWGNFQTKLRDLQRRGHLKRIYNYPDAYHCYRLLQKQTAKKRGEQVVQGAI